MLNRIDGLGCRLGLSVAVFGLAFSLGTGMAAAGEVSAATIIKSLTPKPLTRSLSGSNDTALDQKDEHFIDSVRNKPSPKLSVQERDRIATITTRKPNIDLQINFEFNSAQIAKSAMSTVNELGKALSDASLKGNTFIVGGYADAKGKATYNQSLSERRAQSVKVFLMEHYKIPAADLVTVGYGETHLKDPKHPFAAENRRVAITNMADSKVAGK